MSSNEMKKGKFIGEIREGKGREGEGGRGEGWGEGGRECFNWILDNHLSIPFPSH